MHYGVALYEPSLSLMYWLIWRRSERLHLCVYEGAFIRSTGASFAFTTLPVCLAPLIPDQPLLSAQPSSEREI